MNILEMTSAAAYVPDSLPTELAMLFGQALPHPLPPKSLRRTVSQVNHEATGALLERALLGKNQEAQLSRIKARRQMILDFLDDQGEVFLADLLELDIKRGTLEKDLREMKRSGEIEAELLEHGVVRMNLYRRAER
jgi:hypothetical protein